jgi:translation elongation factor EF-Tu-like GTPase
VYRTSIQAVSVLAIVIGTYMSGAISNEESWQAKVKEMEAKVAAAEIESQKESVKIVEKIVKKTEYITRRGQDIIQYVDREVVKYDDRFRPGGQCELPKEFIKAINTAAEAPK